MEGLATSSPVPSFMEHETALKRMDEIVKKHAMKACNHGRISSVGCIDCVLDAVAEMEEWALPIPPLP